MKVPGCPECEAQLHAVKLDAMGFRAHQRALAVSLLDAYTHGLTLTDLASASGLGVGVIADLLSEADGL